MKDDNSMNSSCRIHADLESFQKANEIFLKNFLSPDSTNAIMYVKVRYSPELSFESSNDRNGLEEWQWVSQKNLFFAQYPVDLDVITFFRIAPDFRDTEVIINIETLDSCNNVEVLQKEVRDLLWTAIFLNQTDSYLCNRDFDSNIVLKTIMYVLTMTWEGYDLSCYIYLEQRNIVSVKATASIWINLTCLFLALYYPMCFKVVELSAIKEKLEDINSIVKEEHKENDQMKEEIDKILGQYYRTERPLGLTRIILRAFYRCRWWICLRKCMCCKSSDNEKYMQTPHEIAIINFSIFFLFLTILPSLYRTIMLSFGDYSKYELVYRAGIPFSHCMFYNIWMKVCALVIYFSLHFVGVWTMYKTFQLRTNNINSNLKGTTNTKYQSFNTTDQKRFHRRNESDADRHETEHVKNDYCFEDRETKVQDTGNTRSVDETFVKTLIHQDEHPSSVKDGSSMEVEATVHRHESHNNGNTTEEKVESSKEIDNEKENQTAETKMQRKNKVVDHGDRGGSDISENVTKPVETDNSLEDAETKDQVTGNSRSADETCEKKINNQHDHPSSLKDRKAEYHNNGNTIGKVVESGKELDNEEENQTAETEMQRKNKVVDHDDRGGSDISHNVTNQFRHDKSYITDPFIHRFAYLISFAFRKKCRDEYCHTNLDSCNCFCNLFCGCLSLFIIILTSFFPFFLLITYICRARHNLKSLCFVPLFLISQWVILSAIITVLRILIYLMFVSLTISVHNLRFLVIIILSICYAGSFIMQTAKKYKLILDIMYSVKDEWREVESSENQANEIKAEKAIVTEDEFDQVFDSHEYCKELLYWSIMKVILCSLFFLIALNELLKTHNFDDNRADYIIKVALVAFSPKLLFDFLGTSNDVSIDDISDTVKNEIKEIMQNYKKRSLKTNTDINKDSNKWQSKQSTHDAIWHEKEITNRRSPKKSSRCTILSKRRKNEDNMKENIELKDLNRTEMSEKTPLVHTHHA